MARIKAEGRTIVFISHKLEEVMSIADAITVMRSGRIVGDDDADRTSLEELARAMVGEAAETPRVRAAAAFRQHAAVFGARPGRGGRNGL